MKTQKNNIYFKKFNFLFFKLCLWIGFGFIFLNFSFLRPTGSNIFIRELIVYCLLFIVINIHTSFLYPKFQKNNFVYILLLIGFVFLCSLFEIMIFLDIFDPSYYYFFDRKKIYIVTFCVISLRNFVLFLFFFWIEYFYRILLFFYKKDMIQRREISFLKEKQEFEKNFSRKKLIPHYFFNILELVRINNSDYEKNEELLDKIKFILYYFLVDTEHEKVEFEKELAFYRYYIDLENLRHKKSITVNFEVYGDNKDFFVIPLLFEPLIGNALKYSKKDGTGVVDITFDISQFPAIKFYCRNNYSKHTKSIISSESGLKILEQRLDLCYNGKHSLKINQSDDYYEVTLLLKVM